ncbi:MAG: hypothetical protein JRI54_00265 [Deltaproteobacteria bacterium]|nr:hypothetical protein [Deltaproteobacteria bacterium]
MQIKQFKLGISAAASWAWGVSLGVSFSILKTMGLHSFLPWAVCNILSLFIYGAFVRKYPGYIKLKNSIFIKLAMIGIQIFCIWINIRIMATYIGNGWATTVATIIFLLTYKYKFKFSVESDQWQYLAMVGGLVLVILTGKFNLNVLNYQPVNVSWVVSACIGLMAGPFLDGQQFQRAERIKGVNPWLLASLAFGLYLSLVFFAFLSQGAISQILFAIIIIAVATSTLDSCIAALQDLSGDILAVVISVAALFSWPLFATKTATQIWTWYATARIFIVMPMILYTVWGYRRWNNGKKISIL